MMSSRTLAVCLTAALLLSAGISTGAQPKRKSPTKKAAEAKVVRDTHPEIDLTGATECRDCHRIVTSEIHEQWFESKHGINNVLCVTCHGGFDNFVKSPPPTRCAACHAAQTDSLSTPFMKGKTCFTCHEPHQLIPHPQVPKPDPGVPENTNTKGGAQ